MSDLYSSGTNRLFYKAVNFAIGKTVTAYFWNPSLVKSALQTFTEIGLGLYYLDYNFATTGYYVGLFYENGVATTMGNYRVGTIMISPGAVKKIYIVNDSNGNPIEGVDVWVTTDQAGSNVVASGVTNLQGQVEFWLDAGTYYMFSQKSGYNFTNPDTETVP